MAIRLLLVAVVLCLCQLGAAFTAGPVQRTAFAAVARSSPAMKTGESVVAELRKASDEDLVAQVDAAKASLYDMRHKRATRQTVKTSDYDQAKYKISVINTILSERSK
jgi:ribosomal protein L29